MSSSGTRKKLSIFRLLVVLAVTAGTFYASWYGLKVRRESVVYTTYEPWFASYVDVTATPLYPFEQLGSTPQKNLVLSFIVSSRDEPCTPTWGTFYTLDDAAVSLDLDRRIARLRQQGGNITISFGGALNDEMAVKCTDLNQLVQAYRLVIERYQLDTIDLDLENSGLNNAEAGARRAEAISILQKELRNQGRNLAVWLTLPMAPFGLTQEGTDAVAVMLEKDVDLSGVNVMTMNYGQSKNSADSMAQASKSGLTETHRQLGILYKQNGINLTSATLWSKIGATPMIGQNDITEEVFTSDDAKVLSVFAVDKGLGRVSLWSANRDIPCGENYVDVKKVSDSCSGVKDEKLTFTNILSSSFTGKLSVNAGIQTIDNPEAAKVIIDDPENSPYQIWKPEGTYPKGVKVVWHGNVYEAKWWTKNDLPDNPVLQAWETPWQLMGPVLPGEKPIKQATLPEGTYPEWSGTEIYEGGERVLFEGIPFQAKWWNEGESPAASEANSDSSPWIPLTQRQINEIIDTITE
jgi:chitinase